MLERTSLVPRPRSFECGESLGTRLGENVSKLLLAMLYNRAGLWKCLAQLCSLCMFNKSSTMFHTLLKQVLSFMQYSLLHVCVRNHSLFEVITYDVIIHLSSISADGIWRCIEDLSSQISFAFLNQTRLSLVPLHKGADDNLSLVPRPHLAFHLLK